jgi:hypothetical protein
VVCGDSLLVVLVLERFRGTDWICFKRGEELQAGLDRERWAIKTPVPLHEHEHEHEHEHDRYLPATFHLLALAEPPGTL